MKLRQLYKLLLIVVPLVVIATFLQQAQVFSPKKNPIYIALVGPMSGEFKSAGEGGRRAIELHLDTINKQGGINGRKVLLDVYDDRNNPEWAKVMADEIIEANRAAVVIGHRDSPTSYVGGQVYKKYGIPVITPTATELRVTENNDWYFRTVFNDRLQAQFLANYLKNVLEINRAGIIHDQKSYGSYLAKTFEKSFIQQGGEITLVRNFNGNGSNREKNLQEIAREIKSHKDVGAIYLATSPTISVVKALKNENIKNTLLAPESYATKRFQDIFINLPEEKLHPGFYTDKMYVANPMNFDTSNEIAQHFIDEFREKYKQKPDWVAAYSHDAVEIVLKAIIETGFAESKEPLNKKRAKIRDYLASMTTMEKAVKGVTGYTLFDKDGNSRKPISIGVYRDGSIISAPIQINAIHDKTSLSNQKLGIENQKIIRFNNEEMFKTHVAYTGLKFRSISDINIIKGSCKLDFYLWFRYKKGLDLTNIQFLNTVEDVELGAPVEETLYGDMVYRLYHVKGNFKLDFLSRATPFKEHIIGVRFQHKKINRNNLIFETDILGMGLNGKKTPLEKIKRQLGKNPVLGWEINAAWFFQDTIHDYSLGNPRNILSGNVTLPFSRFSAALRIKKNEITIRRIFPGDVSPYIAIFALFSILFVRFSEKKMLSHRFTRTFWLIESLLAFLMLIAAETAIIHQLKDTLSLYYLGLIVQVFDVLWWLVPALLINIATERFIWKPLEHRTNRNIPALVRNFTAFIVYLLAVFGIIAFVFDEKITSLLATSGLVATIIGFAVQMNISNIFSGIALNLEHPFRIGDWVRIGGFTEGKVVDVNWRSTKLQTEDECILSIPNAVAQESVIHNFHNPSERYWLNASINIETSYPPEQIQKLLLDSALSVQGVLHNPDPEVNTEILGDVVKYTISFCVVDYGKKSEYETSVWNAIWRNLKRADIQQPTQKTKKPVTLASLLEEVNFLQVLPQETHNALLKRMKSRIIPKGNEIIHQEEINDHIYIIEEGVVAIILETDDENSVEVNRLAVGDYFGEMSLLTGERRTTTAVALTETTLFEISREDISSLIKKYPRMANLLRQTASERRAIEDTLIQKIVKGREEKESQKKGLFSRFKKTSFKS